MHFNVTAAAIFPPAESPAKYTNFGDIPSHFYAYIMIQ